MPIRSLIFHFLFIVSSLVLFTVMGNRFRKTGKVMPPGVVTMIAAGAGIFNAMKYREWS